MNRKAALLVIVVFVLGFALGGLSTHLVGDRVWGAHAEGRGSRGKPGEGRPRMMDQLTQELGLTAEQQKQLAGILEETKGKYQAIFEQMRPQMDQARQEGRARIRGLLTPEQRPKFEEFIRRIDEERKSRMAGEEERKKKGNR